jgi:hypothetical protein
LTILDCSGEDAAQEVDDEETAGMGEEEDDDEITAKDATMGNGLGEEEEEVLGTIAGASRPSSMGVGSRSGSRAPSANNKNTSKQDSKFDDEGMCACARNDYTSLSPAI